MLESFNFLNADCSADEVSLFGSIRTASIRWVFAAFCYSWQGKGESKAYPRTLNDRLCLAKYRLYRGANNMNIQDGNNLFFNILRFIIQNARLK